MDSRLEDGAPLLELRKATKTYGGVHAISEIDFSLHKGEIHALLGENGAGKSTLSKVIAGTIAMTSGQFMIDGGPAVFAAPADALRAGIAMVYQETSLVPSMTVAQNLHLGEEPVITRQRSANIAAQQALQSLNFDVDPLALVESLGTAKRQMVEIARAVTHNARIIIFDEPTASLTPEEIQYLFHLLNVLREQGVAIIFISHAIEEALKIADRITILRDGKLVMTSPAYELDRDRIVQLMVGREVRAEQQAIGSPSVKRKKSREKILSVENVTMGALVKNMSFSVYAGEVVGIAGLVGSGRTEIARVVSGALKRNFLRGGSIYLRGKPVRYRVPRQAIREGIAYVTEDRKLDGFFETMTVDDNIFLGKLAAGPFRFWYRRAERKAISDLWVSALSISALKRTLKIIEYSGGNQQKVVAAKSLAQSPSLVFFDEPTRGVDVGAIPQIHACIRKLADEGKGVVVISSYLPEILKVSDRILVARGGRIVEELDATTATEDQIMFAAIH
jgi:ABC-type sugar transport system ATPase subunit